MQAAVYFLFLLVAGISAKPIVRPASPSGSCGKAPSCDLPSKIKFAYEQGKTYTYDVQSSVKTSASSDSKSAGLQISAQAKVGAIHDCELELELSSVELKDEQGNKINDKKFLDDLSLPLRFEWTDGRIGEVCPTDEKDSQWSLNFKRSVLSAFQNTMDSLDSAEPARELDAAGDCWANYEVESADSNRKVVKWTKDLNQCADRQGGAVANYGMKYSNPMSDINTMPLTEGKQTCKQTVEKRIVQSVECSERLEFLPSRLQEGATVVATEATMRVKLVSESSEQAQAPAAKYVTDLKFDHSYTPADLDGDAQDAEKLLDKMCQADGEVVAESGRDFSDLLDSLRSLSKEEIAKVYEAASKCKATAKMIENIIPDVATRAAASFIVEKVEKLGSSIVREDWLAALRGVQNPSADILVKAAAIATSDNEYTISGRAYLGAGSLLNNFCQRNKDCHNVPEVKQAVQKFADQLAVCRSGSADRDANRRAQYALRALGNAGAAVAADALPEAVIDCMTNKALSAELRLSALEVTRRVPCGHESDNVQETQRKIIQDAADDTEFRSVAAIYALRCPCLRDIDAIRTVITDESRPVSDKFGAFVVSLISRMELSPLSSYWSPELRSTISALMATRHAAALFMKIDALKTGGSMHRQQFFAGNAGYMYDIDLIHSDKSMFPRIARLNVSVGLFGRAINPIEIGLRQEGLESIIDSMPAMDVFEKNTESLINVPRLNTDKLKPVLDKLKLSLFVRVFGSEVRYASVDKEVMDRLRQRLHERVNVESLRDEDGRQAAELFIDRALSLPTVAGLPIRLAIRGSYRSHVRPTMNPATQRDETGRVSSINIKADVKAGLSVELRSSMAAYIGSRQYGVQAVTRLVSKAEYKPEFVFEGRHLKIKVDLPSKTIRAASLSNEVHIRRDKTEEPITVDQALRTAKICTPGVTGLQICLQSEVPSRWNGIMTPGKISMSFEKTDENMRAVEVEFKADHQVDADGKINTVDFKAYVDTPGSAKDRKLLAQLTLSRPEREIKAILETPWKKANLNIKMTGDAEDSQVSASLAMGEEQAGLRNYQVAVKRSMSTVRDGDSSHPKRSISVEVTRSDVSQAILKASGSITDMGALKEISVSIAELHIPNYFTLSSPATLNGEFGSHPTRGLGFLVKGKTEIRDFETEFGIKIQSEGKQVVYSHRLHHQSSASGVGDDKHDRTLLWEVEFKREPARILLLKSILRSLDVPVVDRAAHRLVLLLERPTENDIVTDFEIDVGVEANAKRFKLSQKINRHEMPTMRGFNYAMTVSGLNMIDRTIAVNYHREWSPKMLVNFDAEMRRGDIAIYRVELNTRRDAPGYGEFKLRTICPYSDFVLHAKGDKTDEVTSVHSLRLERNGDLRINFESKARIEEGKRDVEAKLELMGMAPITLSSRGAGSPFDGKWQHDGVLAYNGRKLMFGGNVNYSPKGEDEGVLDMNVYLGTLERMFKQYVNWHRTGKRVQLRGMTEMADDMYKVTGELDMEARRHRLVIEGPRGSAEISGGRLSNQRGFDIAAKYSCPSVELEMFAKAGLDKLRSDITGHFAYKLPEDQVKKIIGFKAGYKADLTNGIDLGFVSGVKVNDKDWFATANVTVIPTHKVALAFGLGDGENFRHRYAIMGSKKWETESLLRLDGEIEAHCTSLQFPRLAISTYKKFSFNKATERLGAYETKVNYVFGEKQAWYTIQVDAMNPREALTLGVEGDSNFMKRVEMKLAYTASMPTITLAVNGRVGQKAARLRGLIDLTKTSTEQDKSVDVSYSVAAYLDENEQAEISIRGQAIGDEKNTNSFTTIEIRDVIYSLNSRHVNTDKKLAEIVLRTPHENFRENIIRISGLKDSDDTNAELLVKIGSKNFRSTVWRKVEDKSRRGEFKIDVNGRVYAAGYTLDHPETMLTRGEHRLRIRIDTPIEGYKTSTVMFWINPCTKGTQGIAAVMGFTDAHPDIKEQRTQMQFAYQIGEEKKGGVMFSARGERNYEQDKLMREASLIVNMPRFNFTIDIESTRVPEEANGWIEYRSQRNGEWRAEWAASGNTRKAGNAHVEVRGKTPEREEPIIVRLSGNHDLTGETKEIGGQIATNMPGYDRIRLRYTQGLDEDGNIANTVELMLPNSQIIRTELAVGFTIEQVDLKFKFESPFEAVREMKAELEAKKEDSKYSIDLKFNRNERKYVIQVSADKTEESISGDINIETPFPALSSASGSFKRTGSLLSEDGSKTTAELLVNKDWTLKVDSEGKLRGEGPKFVSSRITTKSDTYIFEVNKQPGQFEAKLPLPYCTIHYTGKISTADNIYAELRKHHDCSPYSVQGDLTISLADNKQMLLNLETPIPYFTKIHANITYDFDEATYQIEQRMPPTGLYVTIKREDHPLKFEATVNPEEKAATMLLTVRGVTVKGEARVGNPEGGHIDLTIETPIVNIEMRNKREGPWSKPTNVEISLTAAGLDVYSLSGSWDLENYPASYKFQAEGSLLSKPAKLELEGTTQHPMSWTRDAKLKFGQRTHETKLQMEGQKLTINYKNSEKRSFTTSIQLNPSADAERKTFASTYELQQSGYTDLFSTLKWTAKYTIPAAVDISKLRENRENAREVIRTLISHIEWDQKLEVDGSHKYSTDGSLELSMPRDASMVGLQVNYESNRAWNDKKYHVVLKVNKPDEKPTQVEMKLDINGEKKVDVKGSIERREKFSRYAEIKLDFEAPKQMSFHVSRDATDETNRVWKALINFDRSVDAEGTQWQLNVKPEDGVKARGFDLKLTAKRPDMEYVNVEVGYKRSLEKTFEIAYHLFAKAGNMDKKYGFSHKLSVENMVIDSKFHWAALTRDINVDVQAGYEQAKRIFIKGVYDLGTPSSRLEEAIEWSSEAITGFVQLGDKKVTFDGTMKPTDRHNYELDVKVKGEVEAQFSFEKKWSDETKNRTYHAMLKTGAGEIEWTSHRYLADPIRSRGILVRWRKTEWPANEQTQVWLYGEVNMAVPSGRVQMVSDFRNFDYSARVEHGENGAKDIIARFNDEGKQSLITLSLDPLHNSVDMLSIRADGSRLKIHSHIVSTKYAYLEAKRMAKADSTYENLVRLTISLDPAQLHANLKYNTQLAEILREYVSRRREQAQEMLGKYKDNVPQGLQTARDIMQVEQLVTPFVNAMRDERKQLREAERAKWREIAKEWYESPAMKKLFTDRVPDFDASIVGRWLSDAQVAVASAVETSVDRALVAIGQAVRQFVKNDMLPDFRELRMKAAQRLSNNAVTGALAGVRDTARSYALEAIERLRERTWTSCLLGYLKRMPEKLAARFPDNENLQVVRERIAKAVSNVRDYFTEMRDRYVNLDTKTNPVVSSIRETLANAQINYSEGEVDAKIPLSESKFRSLKTPVSMARRVEAVRELLERGVAAVKARLANPRASELSLRRIYGMMQYFRASQLKYLFL